MAKEAKLSELMIREHGEMIAMLNEAEKADSLELFEKLKRKQENHVYAEEKAIFIFDKEYKRMRIPRNRRTHTNR